MWKKIDLRTYKKALECDFWKYLGIGKGKHLHYSFFVKFLISPFPYKQILTKREREKARNALNSRKKSKQLIN